MSMQYCKVCDRNIDTDFDAEHFDEHHEQGELVRCDDCWDEFPPEDIRPYKYEPAIKVCDSCHDERMEAEENDDREN